MLVNPSFETYVANEFLGRECRASLRRGNTMAKESNFEPGDDDEVVNAEDDGWRDILEEIQWQGNRLRLRR